MTDFRVVLPEDSASNTTRELDWEQRPHQWRLSEKGYGELRWEQGLAPSLKDLDYLRDFFKISRTLDHSWLAGASPGELVQIHGVEFAEPQVLTGLCEACGLHWLVFRLEEHSWHRYGRTCDYRWYRGDLVVPKSDAMLNLLLFRKV